MRAGQSRRRKRGAVVVLMLAALAVSPVQAEPGKAASGAKAAPSGKASPAPQAPPAGNAKAEPPPAAAPAATSADRRDEAEDGKDESGKSESPGLPIPRFVSLRTDPINLRTGPGMRYPVDWVYRRRHLPVEVVAEFDTWRRIRDPDGSEGWVHQSMLTGRRTAMVKGGVQPLLRSNAPDAGEIASLEPGVIVNVQRCPPGPVCRVEVNGLQGWLKRDQMWGVYPDETVE